MALNLSQKQNVVAEVAGIAATAHSLIAAEYAGVTVSELTAMRKKARETGVYLKVVKNTLAARAVAGTDYEVATDSLVGPLLYAFSIEEPGAAGRLIKEFAKATGAKFSIVWDKAQATAGKYSPPKMPTSFVIDKEGVVRHVHAGYESGEEDKIAEEVTALLGK